MKAAAALVAGIVLVVVALVTATLVTVPAVAGLGTLQGDVAPSAAAASIPPDYLTLYRAAAATCPGLSWTVLAGVGEVETAHGTLAAPGVSAGANFAGAEGPMQFEPGTFAQFDHPVPADPAPTPPAGVVPPSPYDPVDAVYAAARMLCADGVATDEWAALYAYNHAGWYVSDVLSWASKYGQASAGVAGPSAMLAVQYALSMVGTPYRWGGDTPAGGFDCSGLVQWAYAQSGVSLPRVAQAQHDALPPRPPGAPLSPGDLVFFGSGPSAVDHVGIYVGDGQMVDAPHTGADVRLDAVVGFSPPAVGAASPVAAG